MVQLVENILAILVTHIHTRSINATVHIVNIVDGYGIEGVARRGVKIFGRKWECAEIFDFGVGGVCFVVFE